MCFLIKFSHVHRALSHCIFLEFIVCTKTVLGCSYVEQHFCIFFQYGSAETIFFDSTKVLLTDLKSVPDDVEWKCFKSCIYFQSISAWQISEVRCYVLQPEIQHNKSTTFAAVFWENADRKLYIWLTVTISNCTNQN